MTDMRYQLPPSNVLKPQPHMMQSPYRAGRIFDQVQAPDRQAPTVLCGCFDPLAGGFMICFAMVLEGLLVGFNVFGAFGSHHDWWTGLTDHNPFQQFEWRLLGLLSVGDICAGLTGALALFMSSTDMLTPRRLITWHAWLAQSFMLTTVMWRAGVALVTAPFVGALMAFEPPTSQKGMVFLVTMLYVAAAVFVVFTLIGVYRMVLQESDVIQQQLHRMIWPATRSGPGQRGDMQNFMQGLETDMLLCMPLEPTMAVYTTLMLCLFLISFVGICMSDHTIGGWAFFLHNPRVDFMVAFEGAVIFLSLVICIFGLMGIVLQGAANIDTGAAEDRYTAERNAKRGTVFLLVYLLGSILRVALFLPITAMSLLERDLCGLYVRGLASASLYSAPVPLHCTSDDLKALLGVFLVFCVDVYFAARIWDLWALAQSRQRQRSTGLYVKALPAAYGAAELNQATEVLT